MQLTADRKKRSAGFAAELHKRAFAASGLYDLAPLLQVTMNADFRSTDDQIAPLSSAFLRPTVRAPLYLSVGGAEPNEFTRQTSSLAEKRSEPGVSEIAMPGFDHLVVIEELANEASRLFKAACKMMGLENTHY